MSHQIELKNSTKWSYFSIKQVAVMWWKGQYWRYPMKVTSIQPLVVDRKTPILSYFKLNHLSLNRTEKVLQNHAPSESNKRWQLCDEQGDTVESLWELSALNLAFFIGKRAYFLAPNWFISHWIQLEKSQKILLFLSPPACVTSTDNLPPYKVNSRNQAATFINWRRH